jgi:hypothetical protein
MFIDTNTKPSVDELTDEEVAVELRIRVAGWLRATEEGGYKAKGLKRLKTLIKRKEVSASDVVIAVGQRHAALVFDALPNLFKDEQNEELLSLLRAEGLSL